MGTSTRTGKFLNLKMPREFLEVESWSPLDVERQALMIYIILYIIYYLRILFHYCPVFNGSHVQSHSLVLVYWGILRQYLGILSEISGGHSNQAVDVQCSGSLYNIFSTLSENKGHA